MDCTKGIMFSFRVVSSRMKTKVFMIKFTTSFSEHQMEGNGHPLQMYQARKESGKLDVKEQEEEHPISELGPWPALSMQPRLLGTGAPSPSL